jgi:hypothetical protein
VGSEQLRSVMPAVGMFGGLVLRLRPYVTVPAPHAPVPTSWHVCSCMPWTAPPDVLPFSVVPS